MALDASDIPVLAQMKDYPLQPGQALLLGPLSIAYLKGDVLRAPWLFDPKRYRPPNGKLLPDMLKLEREEWAR